MGMTSKVFRAAAQIGLFIVLLGGCGDSGAEEPPKEKKLTYCDNIDAPAPTCLDPGFDPDEALQTCASSTCHGVGNVGFTWTLDLSNGAESALADLIDVSSDFGAGVLVDSDNIDCSYILSKVTAADAAEVSGSVMPLAPEQPWSAGEVDCFRKFLHDNFAN
jgi:hypothetical protein